MLEPPPEGTFDIDEGILPIKNTPNGSTPPNGTTPEQVPLIAHEEDVQTDSNASGKTKVRIFC